MKVTHKVVFLTVLSSLIVGGCAGIITSIVTSNALENYANALLGDRGFTALEPRKPGVNPLTYDQAVEHVRDTEARSVAIIAPRTVDSAVPDKWIGPENGTGLGVVVSANGWVLATDDELADFQNPKTSADVWIRGTRYSIENLIRDQLTSFVLLKLADANGLSPVGFGASEDAQDGDMLFALPSAQGFVATTLQSGENIVLDGPHPAEQYATSWKLADLGAVHGPVLSTGGDMMGFVNVDGTAVPLHHGLSFIQEVIRSGAPAHAALGAYVVNLADIYNLDPEIRQGFSSGALIIAPNGKIAVPIQTPASDAGLMNHDIITAIDGEAVTPHVSVAELLSAYDPGQTARVSVVRAGAPIEIPVVLGDAATLVY